MQKEISKTGYKYRILLWKRYLDYGYGLMTYPKLLIAVIGIGEIVKNNYLVVLSGAIVFVAFCFFFGWLYIKFGWYEAEIELSNWYNLFVKEMREHMKKRKSI